MSGDRASHQCYLAIVRFDFFMCINPLDRHGQVELDYVAGLEVEYAVMVDIRLNSYYYGI